MVDRFLIAGGSEVLVGRGFPRPLLPERAGRERVAMLVQPGSRSVAARAAAGVDLPVLEVELPDREAAKDLDTVGSVYRRLADAGIGRHDTLIGVGGGAATDVAGFVAATWLRGVEWVAVPTTMLGAVDASLGGKTGINLGGKNLVGAFWQPSRVVIDLDVLDGLPLELLREGSAESLKAGYVADRELVEIYEREGLAAPLELVVPRAVAVKVAVVSEDFRETGRRAILNFGHTIGHAVERMCGLPHGHAVAVGMVAAAEISRERHGFDAARLRTSVARLGLPTHVTACDADQAMELIDLDKKRDASGVRMVLLRDVGEPVVEPVTAPEVLVALAAIGAI
ncbi:MAG: 3-dehydroquinate synthase family protein [Acidimicrobiia bacterium]